MDNLYDLTPMTGKEASANRTVVIGTVEMNYRVWIITACAMPLGLFFTAFAMPILGSAGLASIPLTVLAAVYLFHQRTLTGMKIHRYQAIWDKKKAPVDKFFICGIEVDFNAADERQVIANTAPYRSTDDATVEDQRVDTQDDQPQRTRAPHSHASVDADPGAAAVREPEAATRPRGRRTPWTRQPAHPAPVAQPQVEPVPAPVPVAAPVAIAEPQPVPTFNPYAPGPVAPDPFSPGPVAPAAQVAVPTRPEPPVVPPVVTHDLWQQPAPGSGAVPAPHWETAAPGESWSHLDVPAAAPVAAQDAPARHLHGADPLDRLDPASVSDINRDQPVIDIDDVFGDADHDTQGGTSRSQKGWFHR